MKCASRVDTFDAVRALALILMAADHAVVVLDAGHYLRDLTRVALPLFMVTAGFLARRPFTSRYFDVVLVAVCTLPLVWYLSLAFFPILVVFVLVFPLVSVPARFLPLVASLAILQGEAWPIAWGGYQPGYVLSFLILGRLLRDSGFSVPSIQWPQWLVLMGRYPLYVYSGHLILLLPFA